MEVQQLKVLFGWSDEVRFTDNVLHLRMQTTFLPVESQEMDDCHKTGGPVC